MARKIDFGALRAQTLGAGQEEEAVTVNTRALIDKVLARYSGEWTVLRELLQNAADASASKVTVKFETIPSSSVALPQTTTKATLLQHTILHHTLKSLNVTNNGQPFGPNDWSRLKRIAEGNPDETKIGAFGVGFYSVFSDCEEPFVSSGQEAMAFYWKGNSLFTRRMHLSEAQASPDTTFVLDYRNSTSPVPPLLPLAQFFASSLTFVGLTAIELWLDDWKLLSLNKLLAPGNDLDIPKGLNTKTTEGIMKVGAVNSETAQIKAKWLSIVGWKPNSASSANENPAKGSSSAGSLRTFFSKFATGSSSSTAAAKAAREERAAQELISEDLLAECSATVFLHINTAIITTSISKSFGAELERATKKPAPKSTRIAVLTASHEEAEQQNHQQSPANLIDIFASVLPSKSGRIYIGFPTHQTTGLAAHVSAPSVIPTVERESIDLNARWVRTWNTELLRAVGIVCRIAWSGAIDVIRENLDRRIQELGHSVLKLEHIDKVLPLAVHLLNQFTFRDSTPSSQVGSLVEEAFWTCNSTTSIEILSSRGIALSQHVRLATDELSFVAGIPTVPPVLLEQAKGFVQKLIDHGIITDVTTGDIKKELEAQAINVNQMIEFLHWISHKAQIHEVDKATIESLLDATVVNDAEEGKVWLLGQIRHFVEPSRLPSSLPVPENTLPYKFTRGINRSDLVLIGWDDLKIVPWLHFLIENAGGRASLSSDQDLTGSAGFAGQVLAVISKQWDGLPSTSKNTVVELLSANTTVPTKMGMRKPSNAYFPSVRLFNDLPIVNVSSVKERFLSALGVRKTIELDLVFDRLLGAGKQQGNAAWSHVDLIKYLASVRDDIPRPDIIKLHNTAICTIGGAVGEQARYRVSELFEPHDELRSLGLKVMHWPGVYRPNSEEGRFLKTLGIRTHPTVPELINIISSSSKEENFTLRERALRYIIEFFHKHGYSSDEFIDAPIPFLPIEDTDSLASPAQCFINEKVRMMGFNILRKDLHPHADKFAVQSNPPIADCVDWLTNNPPSTKHEAREIFNYFAARLNELSGRPLSLLSEASIIPVTNKVPSTDGKSPITRRLPPKMVFLGSGGRYADIFEYVDFGTVANSFLLRCGSKNEPTTSELALLVVREPARIFSTFGSAERYIDLLSTIAKSWKHLKPNRELVKDMKRSAFLLAYVEYPAERTTSTIGGFTGDEDEEDATVRTYQLARADQILIADDVVNYSLFKTHVLAAPPDEDLENFYSSLGSRSLSDVVEEQPKVGNILSDPKPSAMLKKLVLERIKIFYHDIPRDQIRRDLSWIDKNLTFIAVASLSVRKSLSSTKISHTENIGAIPSTHPSHGKVIYFLTGNRDYFHVSQALVHICLLRPKPHQAVILTTLLENDLHKLRARGYDVSRILKKKAAEACIAEEKRQKQLEEEKQKMAELETNRREHQEQLAQQNQKEKAMPGFFPDSPEQTGRTNEGALQPTYKEESRRPKGLLSSIQRSLGFNPDRPSATNIPSTPSYINETGANAIATGASTRPQKPVTSPSDLQRNLLNAIGSSRAHNSSNVTSNPVMTEVKETQTFCDTRPGQNIGFFGEADFGLKVFLSNSMQDKQRFMATNSSALNAFATIMVTVADALHLSRKSLHLFYDGESSTIAFNQNRALFFNYRYFQNLHLPDVQQGKVNDAVVYWFVTTCHELAHNIVSDHSAAHSYYTESFVAHFFARVVEATATTSRSATNLASVPVSADPPPSYS